MGILGYEFIVLLLLLFLLDAGGGWWVVGFHVGCQWKLYRERHNDYIGGVQ